MKKCMCVRKYCSGCRPRRQLALKISTRLILLSGQKCITHQHIYNCSSKKWLGTRHNLWKQAVCVEKMAHCSCQCPGLLVDGWTLVQAQWTNQRMHAKQHWPKMIPNNMTMTRVSTLLLIMMDLAFLSKVAARLTFAARLATTSCTRFTLVIPTCHVNSMIISRVIFCHSWLLPKSCPLLHCPSYWHGVLDSTTKLVTPWSCIQSIVDPLAM